MIARVEAVVALPKGLGKLHSAFSYQLTPVGGPALNLHVAQQVRGDKFKIAGGTSRLKVSWQIAGELKDRRLGIEHAPEEPFDQKMARDFNHPIKRSSHGEWKRSSGERSASRRSVDEPERPDGQQNEVLTSSWSEGLRCGGPTDQQESAGTRLAA